MGRDDSGGSSPWDARRQARDDDVVLANAAQLVVVVVRRALSQWMVARIEHHCECCQLQRQCGDPSNSVVLVLER